ncbi:hypothetical protein [Anaerocaecibacter muris]|uniref:hypothetical protein n=1 Tax=Anaerocaecibacter muris TaxID=2941513 RepID=UPI003F692561
MKKITSIATALCMATAFCGFCTGCAAEIKDNGVAGGTHSAMTSADSQYKVILSPGYQQGFGSTENTVSSGATKLTEAQEGEYFVSNAYFATVAAGEDLPAAETTRAKTTFVGWTYAKDGVVETVEKMPASLGEDLYLYAQWQTEGGGAVIDPTPEPEPEPEPQPGKDTGLVVNGTLHKLVVNAGNTTTTEYWLGADATVKLTKGDVVTLQVNGTKISAFIDPSSIGVDKSNTSTAQSSFKVTTTGAFSLYLRANKDGTYTVEFTGPSDIGEETELPQGTASTLTFSDGVTLTIYLKDSAGNDVTDLSKYKIWMWNSGGNYFAGEWNSRPVLTSKITLNKAFAASLGMKFTWGANSATESGNFNGFEANGTYLITLAQGGGTIAKIKVS